MHRSVPNVLFVSRDNAARSLLAEAGLRHIAKDRLKAFSCGVPRLCNGAPQDWAILALKAAGISTTGLSCKDWTSYTRSGAPRMDIVIALDAATLPDHPVWPGQPMRVLWDYPRLETLKGRFSDPAVAAVHMLHSLRRRIELLVCLQAKSLSRTDLQQDLRDLGHL